MQHRAALTQQPGERGRDGGLGAEAEHHMAGQAGFAAGDLDLEEAAFPVPADGLDRAVEPAVGQPFRGPEAVVLVLAPGEMPLLGEVEREEALPLPSNNELRELMHASSLESVFRTLVIETDIDRVARDLVDVMRA